MRSHRRRIVARLAATAFLMSTVTIPAATGVAASFDAAWGGGAVVWTPAVDAWPAAVVTSSDGATLVASVSVGNPRTSAIVQRLDAAGNVDPQFGTSGAIMVESPALGDSVGELGQGLALQPGTGRIIVAGRQSGKAQWVVSAWTADGRIDTSFGTQGWVDPLPEQSSVGDNPVVRTDSAGRILVAGFALDPLSGQVYHGVVVRLTADGQLDPTFGNGGRRELVGLPSTYFETGVTTEMLVDPSGRIVIGGRAVGARAFIARLTPSGDLDPSFGQSGVTLVDANVMSCADDITFDDRGGVAMLCAFPVFGQSTVAVRRFDGAGHPDTTWGSNGWAVVPRSAGAQTQGRAITFVNGGIVVVGRIADVDNLVLADRWDAAVWRLTADGQLDLGAAPHGVERIADPAGTEVLDAVPGVGSRLTLLLDRNGSGRFTGVATITPGPSTATTPSVVPVQPERLLDTRLGLGAPAGPIRAGVVLELQVTGRAGVPADARAVAVNVTATESAANGFLTVFPCGGSVPVASNLNWSAGDTVPNLVIAGLSATGRICLYSNVDVHAIVDLNGWYPADTDYRALPEPIRRLDTRVSTFGTAGQIGGAKLARLFGPTGTTDLLDEVVLNVTVTEPVGAGFLTVFPCGQATPTASNINFVTGQTVANLVVVAISHTVPVCFYSNVATHLVVDVLGTVDLGSGHRTVVPERLLDTRLGLGASAGTNRAGSIVELQVSGRAGVPATARAVTLNVTVTEPVAAGFVTVYPCGSTIPTASNVNVVPGETRANAVLVGLDPQGRVCLYSNITTHLVVDVAEWLPARSR